MSWETVNALLASDFSTFSGASDVFFENLDIPDLTQRRTPFYTFKVVPRGIEQIELGPPPRLLRYTGFIEIGYYFQEGSGVKGFTGMLDALTNKYVAQSITDVVFYKATVLSPVTFKGWNCRKFLVPFHFDTIQ